MNGNTLTVVPTMTAILTRRSTYIQHRAELMAAESHHALKNIAHIPPKVVLYKRTLIQTKCRELAKCLILIMENENRALPVVTIACY